MQNLAGIERSTREKLIEIRRGTDPVFDVQDASRVLKMPANAVAKLLARWVKQGWLIRVKRGSYMAVPPEARSGDEVSEEPLIVASRVFDPCYIGGWSAAEQWGLTEQIFRTIIVVTTRKVSMRDMKIRSTDYLIKTISPSRFFGIKNIWRQNFKVGFSDPTKTVVDILDDPPLVGGGRMLADIVNAYVNSEDYDASLLLDYSARMNNGAIYKRLGYLMEQIENSDKDLLAQLRVKLTSGNSKLDPSIPCQRLVTRWRLFVPNNGERPRG